jgi:hypothetical protein
MSLSKPVVQFQLDREEEQSGEGSGRPSDASPVPPLTTPPSTLEPGTEVSATRARFMHLVRSAVMVNRLIGLGDEAKAKVSISLASDKAPDRKPTESVIRPRASRVAGLVPKLQNMGPTQDIAAHAALVRHMEVSVQPTASFVPIVDRDFPVLPRRKVLGYLQLGSYLGHLPCWGM